MKIYKIEFQSRAKLEFYIYKDTPCESFEEFLQGFSGGRYIGCTPVLIPEAKCVCEHGNLCKGKIYGVKKEGDPYYGEYYYYFYVVEDAGG